MSMTPTVAPRAARAISPGRTRPAIGGSEHSLNATSVVSARGLNLPSEKISVMSSPVGSLGTPPLFAALDQAQHVLVAGAGGGFDVYAGLPLALALAAQGKRVDLANLSFSRLDEVEEERWIGPSVVRIDADATGQAGYFPERTLARWLASEGHEDDVYAIRRAGLRPVAAAYRALHERLAFDAIVLVDGGTDILMHGNESGLGTPEEDVTSLLAAAAIDVPTKLVVCVGFGIDAFHGVCDAQVLENLAELDRAGAYLGALSIPRDSPEGRAYLDAVAHAALHTAQWPSIVNGQIAAALKGEFGDVHITDRISGSELFVNPLMTILFTVLLDPLADRVQYAADLADTDQVREVSLVIERYRTTHPLRPRRALPH